MPQGHEEAGAALELRQARCAQYHNHDNDNDNNTHSNYLSIYLSIYLAALELRQARCARRLSYTTETVFVKLSRLSNLKLTGWHTISAKPATVYIPTL